MTRNPLIRTPIATLLLPVLLAQPALAEAPSPAAAAAADLATIARLDDDPAGPRLNAVIAVNPQAPAEAARLATTGILRGRTVLVKDNIETR